MQNLLNSNIAFLHKEFSLNGLKFIGPNDLANCAEKWVDSQLDFKVSAGAFILEWLNNESFVTVNTSGSTGTPKTIRIQKEHMVNSAKATAKFFSLPAKATVLHCLPSNFIAGKMMLVRAMVMGWQVTIVPPKSALGIEAQQHFDFVAMVPFQVYNSLSFLNHFKILIIGGGSVSQDLEAKLQLLNVNAFSTYGMTETVSHIAVRALNGNEKSDFYKALPNVKFSTDKRNCLLIDAPKVSAEKVITNDVVSLQSRTEFKWLGRFDNVINSGGIKMYPETIEEKIASEIETDFIIASQPDEALGEQVILILEQSSQTIPSEKLQTAFSKLQKYERPKQIYRLANFPKTETGKIKRPEVLKMLGRHN